MKQSEDKLDNIMNLLKLSMQPTSALRMATLEVASGIPEDLLKAKAALTWRIRRSSHILVVIGAYANSFHRDRSKIGERNWQWWEIKKADEEGKGFIAVKIDPKHDVPEPLYGKGATWARTFTVQSILNAINGA